MFDQTLLPERDRSTRPLNLLASVTLQVIVICSMLLLSIAGPQHLPVAQLRSIFLRPTAPAAAHVLRAETNAPSAAQAPRTFVLNLKNIIPRAQSTTQSAPAAAPDISAYATGNSSPDGVLSDVLGASGTAASAAPPNRPKQATQPARPLSVTSSIAAANLIYKVTPQYPRLARAAGIQGTVEFSAVIDKQGRIQNLQLLKGHPLLIRAAMEAVMQWRYRPTLLNGVAVEVMTSIVVNFRLN